MPAMIFVNLPVKGLQQSTGFYTALVDRALATGGTAPRGPQDEGFTCQRSFTDPDGHLFEIIRMDMNAGPA